MRCECEKRLGAGAHGTGRFVPPTPGLGGVVEMLGLLFGRLRFFDLSGFGSGASAFGAGGIVVAPPPGMGGGGRDGAERKGQGESG